MLAFVINHDFETLREDVHLDEEESYYDSF
jgi:hypothetical protein